MSIPALAVVVKPAVGLDVVRPAVARVGLGVGREAGRGQDDAAG
jgi:hypothetical protein